LLIEGISWHSSNHVSRIDIFEGQFHLFFFKRSSNFILQESTHILFMNQKISRESNTGNLGFPEASLPVDWSSASLIENPFDFKKYI